MPENDPSKKKPLVLMPFYFVWSLMATVLSYTVSVVFCIVMMFLGLFLLPLNGTRLWNFAATVWAGSFFFWMGKVIHIKGLSNRKKGRTYLVVSNHASYYDIPAIMTFIPDVLFVAKDSLFKVPFFGFFIKMMGCVPISRESLKKSLEALEKAARVTNRHRPIVIFPEGTRTRDGNIQEFKKGFTRILRAGDVDILPVTISGMVTMKPRNRPIWRDMSARLDMEIHEPIPNAELIRLTDEEIMARVKSVIEQGYHR